MINRAIKKPINEQVERIQSIMGLVSTNEQVVGGLPWLGGTGLFTLGGQKKMIDWFKSFDYHDWLTTVEILSGLAGAIPTPLTPVLLGISAAAGVANGLGYISEGDKYTGGLMIAFSILPAHQLYSVLKNSATLRNAGVPAVKEALEAVGEGVATKQQKQLVKEIVEETVEDAPKLVIETQKHIFKQSLLNFSKKSIKYVLAVLVILSKLGFGLAKVGIVIGGIFFTYDELYLFFNGGEDRGLAIRQNNSLAKMKDYLLKNEESIKQELIQQLREKENEILKNSDKFVVIQLDPENDSLFLKTIQEKRKLNQNLSVTFDDVLKGKINPTNNMGYVFKKGDKGKDVGKIQSLLDKLGYDMELSGFGNENEYVDDIYGDNTKYAVVSFQKENKLPETGVVDSKTLKLMIQKQTPKLVIQKQKK